METKISSKGNKEREVWKEGRKGVKKKEERKEGNKETRKEARKKRYTDIIF